MDGFKEGENKNTLTVEIVDSDAQLVLAAVHSLAHALPLLAVQSHVSVRCLVPVITSKYRFITKALADNGIYYENERSLRLCVYVCV